MSSADDAAPHDGRRIRFGHLALGAALVLGFLGLVFATSAYDLFGTNRAAPPDRGHEEAPRPTSSFLTLVTGPLEVRLNGSAPRVWPADSPHLVGGAHTLVWAGDGHRLVVRFRADNPAPQRLIHDADLSRRNSYNVAWDGAPAAPADGSYVDYLTQDVIERHVSGRLHLVLADATLDGRWPHEVDGPNYRGMLSFAFFGGAALVAAIGWWRKRRAQP